jgi:hypothetical protein
MPELDAANASTQLCRSGASWYAIPEYSHDTQKGRLSERLLRIRARPVFIQDTKL